MRREPTPVVHQVRSADGTRIAFEQVGEGPTLAIVTGALGDRSVAMTLAPFLAARFTVFAYDRRGRGDSSDTPPYAVEREVEDLEAVIGEGDTPAFVFGHSSGAALALEAAVRGAPISRLVVYEPPYIVNGDRPPLPDDYVPTLSAFVAQGRDAEAVEYFWQVALLMPPDLIRQMRDSSMWPGIAANARSLPYDGAVMGDHMSGNPLPAEWGKRVTIPTLVIDGAESPPSLHDAAAALAAILPDASRRTLEGVGHGAPPELIAPILASFFLDDV